MPAGIAEACALIGTGAARAIDVGTVTARGQRKPRMFLEMASVGLTAVLMPAGQDAKNGAWQTAAAALPRAMGMAPVPVAVKLDKRRPHRRATTLLVEVANAPRLGPGLMANLDARMDDGLLDVSVYHGVGQAALAARLVALKAGARGDDPRIERLRSQRVEIKSAIPLPVVADSKVVGRTPAEMRVRPGALLVIAGPGSGLAHPVSASLVDAASQAAEALKAPAPPNRADPVTSVPVANGALHGPLAAVTAAVVPAVGSALGTLSKARALTVPAAAAAGGAAALPLLRLVTRGLRNGKHP